jgi:hypothetical protein
MSGLMLATLQKVADQNGLRSRLDGGRLGRVEPLAHLTTGVRMAGYLVEEPRADW